MTAETQIQQLARITGLDEATVAAALGRPPAPRPLMNDAELDDAYRRVERGGAAEAELNYRALVRDCDPSLYIDDDLGDAA